MPLTEAWTAFLGDRDALAREGQWLAELDVTDPESEATVTLRYSQRGYRTGRDDSPARTSYPARLVAGVDASWSHWQEGSLGGTPSIPTYGSIELRNGDRGLDAMRNWRWAGGRARLRFVRGRGGAMALADAPVEQLEMGEPAWSLRRVTVPLLGLEERFNQPLSKMVFRGTGNCAHLAAGSYIDCGSPAATNLTGTMTLEGNFLWTAGGSTTNIWGYLGGTRYPWLLRSGGTNRPRLLFTSGGGTLTDLGMSAGVEIGEWPGYHLAVVLSGGTATFVLYRWRTGEEWVETYAVPATRDAQLGGSLRMGHATAGFAGFFDDMRVWNVARSLEEIQDGRVGPLDDKPASLKGYWKLDEASGTAAADSSGSGITGTLNGSATWLPSCTGNADLAGQPMPDVWGQYGITEPIQVDEATQVWCWASGAQQSVVLSEGGKTISLGVGGEHTDLKTFLTTAAPAGGYSRMLSLGLFKVPTAPGLPLRVAGEGNIGGGYTATAGGIIRRIATLRGGLADDSSALDLGSFATLDAAAPDAVGLVAQGDMTQWEAMAKLAASVGARVGYQRWDDHLGVLRFEGPGTPKWAFERRHLRGLTAQARSLGVWQIALYYRPQAALTEDQISSSVPAGQRTTLKRAWQRWLISAPEVLTKNPRAAQLEIYTQLYTRTSARDLARFLWRLFQRRRLFDVELDWGALLLSLADSFSVRYEERGQPVLWYDGSLSMIPVAIRHDAAGGGIVVTALGEVE